MKKANVTHVNNEHSYWLRSLNFYKTEISILRGILTEIASKNTGAEAMKEVEHFENQFNIQTDNINQLSHSIHANLSNISKQAQQSNAGYIDAALVTEHAALNEKYENEVRVVTEVITSFRKFAGEWM